MIQENPFLPRPYDMSQKYMNFNYNNIIPPDFNII